VKGKGALAAIVVALASGVACANAGAKINCHSWSCVNRVLNQMQATVSRDDKFVRGFAKCLAEVPVTEYGDGSLGTFGYVWNPGSGGAPFNTTALDITASGKRPDGWLLQDACRTAKAPARDAVGSGPLFGPIAPEGSLSMFGGVNR
jgi:hypothetical protein